MPQTANVKKGCQKPAATDSAKTTNFGRASVFSSFRQRKETLSADGCGPYDATGKMLTGIHGSQIRKQNMSTCVRTISLQVGVLSILYIIRRATF